MYNFLPWRTRTTWYSLLLALLVQKYKYWHLKSAEPHFTCFTSTKLQILLLDDPELWLDHLTLSWECHTSRKRDRTTEDGTFLLHKKGDITSTFTGDWLLTEGESRDKLGEWLKKTQVRYQDQRRMLKSIIHCFPSNSQRYSITVWSKRYGIQQETRRCNAH
jgi:hypothetical protein